MKTKNLIFLIIVLAILAILSVRLNKLPPSYDSVDQLIGKSLIDIRTIRKTKSIQIDFADKDSINFKAGYENTWFISSFNNFPVDFPKLTALSKDLSDVKILRNVSANPDVLGRLELGLNKITLRDSEENILQVLDLGKETQKGGQYVKKSDSDEAYLLERSLSLQNDPNDWIDSSVLDVDVDAVQSLYIPSWEENQPPFELARVEGQDTFKTSYQPEGKTLVVSAANAFLEELLTISFDEIATQTDPVVIKAMTYRKDFTLQLVSGQSLTISVARTPEKKELKQIDPTSSIPSDDEDLSVESSNTKNKDIKESSEPEYETIPAGDAYIIYQLKDSKNPWKPVTDTFAFKIRSTDFKALKPDFYTLFESPETEQAVPSEG